MTARKRKSGRRTNGSVSLKLRRDGSSGGKEEEEVGSSEAPVHTITASPPSHRQPLPLPVTPNTSLLDLTVTYDYRPSVVGEGPDITTEELSSMFTFKDSPTVHPPLLPLWGDLGCSPQLPARKRPRTSHSPSPPHTTSTPQQNRFQRLERLAQQLHQCLSEPQEGQHPTDRTTLTSPHHNTDHATLTSPYHHTDHTNLTSPHHRTDHTTLTSPHHHTDHTTLSAPHHHTDHTTLTSPHHHTDHTNLTSPHHRTDHTTLTSPHHHTDHTNLTSPHHHTDHTNLTSPHHRTDHTTLTSPHHHTDHTTLTSPHHHTDHTTLSAPHHHTDHQPRDTIGEDDNMFWSQAADVIASSCWEHTPSPEHPSTPVPLPEHPSTPLPEHPSTPLPERPSSLLPGPFEESDADAFIDQLLLSDGICLTTPATHTTWETKGLPRSSNGSANSSVSAVQASTNPVKETQAGTGPAVDCGVVIGAAGGTNVKATCSDSKDGRDRWGRGAVDGNCEQLSKIVKCNQREIERKRELARLRLSQRQRWKPAPANTQTNQ